MQKGVLYEVARQVKSTLISIMEKVQISSELSMQLLQTMFGPNNLTKLAIKRNQDLLKVLASQMSEATVTQYLETMVQQFKNPDVDQHFGSEKSLDQTKQENRIEVIRAFCLS